MWHQLWSCSSVAITRSASSAPGDRSLTVTRAVVAPAWPAARTASFVIRVPPSCETATTTPSRGGRCATLERRDRASVAARRQVERLADEPREPHRRVLGGAAAGGDDRPALGGRPAETIRELLQRSVLGEPMDQPLGERRFGGDHLRHEVRRPRPELRHVGRRPRIRRAGQRLVHVASHGRIVGHAEGVAEREELIRTA